jgi:RNA polymerase sigma-70 factor, ECF subfamily
LLQHDYNAAASTERHPHSGQLSDEELLGGIRVGCDECFGLLFHRYLRQVVSLSFAILRDRSEAEDILQEVFLSIYLQQEKYDSSRGTAKTWILQFAYYKSLLRRRYLRIRNFYRNEEIQEGKQITALNGGPYPMNPGDWAHTVERAVSSLNAKQRKAIELIHVQGCTLQETADALGESLANTRNHYYRGLKALRMLLNASAEKEKQAQSEILERQVSSGFES